ncbi:YheC/YheD family protein [Pseudalkalibacillus caeni]|nr:YheC/YheD family protein [Pseudalkalibacillus caeni]
MKLEEPLMLKKDLDSSNTLFVPETLFETWTEQRTFPDHLSFGSKTAFCKIDTIPGKKEALLLSADLWNILGLPYEFPVHLFQKGKSLHIGPLIGIYTAGFTSDLLRPVGDRSLFFAKQVSASKHTGGYAFVFGSHLINWDSGTIKGYFHTKKGWQQAEVPMPNVIYERLPNRKTEQADITQEVLQKLKKDYFIPLFNPGFFDKWDLYEKLKDDQHAIPYLPETRTAPEVKDIRSMLNIYEHVYLKPARGSLGIGIQQIIKPQNDYYYYCRFRKDDENRLRKYKSLPQLLANQFPEGLLSQLLVQQGIHLIRKDHRPIDFRVHTNKNKYGNWEVSTIAAKIAGTGSLTTHLSYSGEVKTIPELAKEIDLQKEVFDNLQSAALTLSHIIERKTNGIVGEIGFDFGVDKSGKVWLFEANSKPGRAIFKHPHLQKEEARTRILPLEFALFLSEASILKKSAAVR